HIVFFTATIIPSVKRCLQVLFSINASYCNIISNEKSNFWLVVPRQFFLPLAILSALGDTFSP
ncbi:MAG: hypothetical protein R6U28_09910, partial [Cyclonatronaceae bacterium]